MTEATSLADESRYMLVKRERYMDLLRQHDSLADEIARLKALLGDRPLTSNPVDDSQTGVYNQQGTETMTAKPEEKPTRVIWLGDSIWKGSEHQVRRPKNIGKHIADMTNSIDPSFDTVEIIGMAVEADDDAEKEPNPSARP